MGDASYVVIRISEFYFYLEGEGGCLIGGILNDTDVNQEYIKKGRELSYKSNFQ